MVREMGFWLELEREYLTESVSLVLLDYATTYACLLLASDDEEVDPSLAGKEELFQILTNMLPNPSVHGRNQSGVSYF